jgi:cytochrome c
MKSVYNFIVISLFLIFCSGKTIKSANQLLLKKSIENVYYMLMFQHSNKCIDVESFGGPGASIVQWPCTGSDNQRWKIQYNDDGSVSLIVKHSGAFLDIQNGNSNNGAIVQTWWGNGADAQKFWLIPTDSGHMSLKSKISGRCLEVGGFSSDDKAGINLWDCWGGGNQRVGFLLVEAN